MAVATVDELMTREVAAADASDPIERAEEALAERGHRHVVVTHGGRIVGVVSERDVLRARVGTGFGEPGRLVRDVMSSPAETIAAGSEVTRAASAMASRKIGCLPVVDGDALVGIVTSTDLLWALARRGLAEPSRRRHARHAFTEHPGELELEVEGPDLGEALAEAGRALCSLTAGDAPIEPEGEPEHVVVSASDAGALLVAFLNELVYLNETRKKVYPEIEVESASERMARATVRGAEPSVVRTQVKAATMHRLDVHRTVEGVKARVVLDV